MPIASVRYAAAAAAAAAALLLGVCFAAFGSATVVENFTPPEDQNKEAIVPGLWNQVGEVSVGDGRGTDAANKAAMLLSEYHPTAETVLLEWDGTKDTLDFWYYLNLACDTGDLKISMSCKDGKDWFVVWTKKQKDMQVKAYNIARVKLPLNATCTEFAVRWDYEHNCWSSQYIYIDEITFPARGFAAAEQQSTASLSSTTAGTEVSFNGDAGQNAGQQDGSKQPETTSNKGSSPGAAVVATGGDANVVVKTSSKGSRVHPGKGWWLLPVLYMCLL